MEDDDGNLIQAGNIISGNKGDGVHIDGASHDNLVVGNIIGLSKDSSEEPNRTGVFTGINSSKNIIGGSTPAQRNVISGNLLGIELFRSDQTVAGNFIGTDIPGDLKRGNQLGGIAVGGSGHTIGGDQLDA